MSRAVEITAEPRPLTGLSLVNRYVVTTIGATITGYFVIVAFCIYWLAFLPAAAMSYVIPKRLHERLALPLLIASSLGVAALTQTIDTFFPDYADPSQILRELALWCGVGIFARCYLVYTAQPETFEDIRKNVAARWPDSWFAANLHNPLDAAFARIWIGNTIATLPVTALMIWPSTFNYFVLAAWTSALLLALFPEELIEHTHMHNRLFTAKLGSPEGVKRKLRVCQWWFEYGVSLLTVRIPDYYRIQHIYVHHVEGNGPEDTQCTMRYDRTSFLDFSRHALIQGLDMLTGMLLIPYLRRKGKTRQLRDLLFGMGIFYTAIIAVAWLNPIAAGFILFGRLMGGQIISFFSFFQHGLVDRKNPFDAHGNTIDFDGPEHGNLGADFHVEHHLKPARHWSVYAHEFAKEADHEHGHAAVVIDKGFYSPLGMMRALWTRDYAGIAERAHLRETAGDPVKLAALIHERTRPFYGEPELVGINAKIDLVLGKIMGKALPIDLRVGP